MSGERTVARIFTNVYPLKSVPLTDSTMIDSTESSPVAVPSLQPSIVLGELASSVYPR